MARQSNNLIMRNTRGMLGEQIVFKRRKGTRYVAAPPEIDENRTPTDNQLTHQERFKKASDYANKAIKDPDTKKAYERVANRKQSAQNMAFRDAFYPPEILSVITQGYIGSIGNIIVINAKDDFKVTSVSLSISNADGKLIEEGEAIANKDGMLWVYACTTGNSQVKDCSIQVCAFDIPGNKSVMTVTT